MPDNDDMLDVIFGLDEVRKCGEDTQCYLCQAKLTGDPGILIHMPGLDPDDDEFVFLACEECANDFIEMCTAHMWAVFNIMVGSPSESDDEPEKEGKVVKMPQKDGETSPDAGEEDDSGGDEQDEDDDAARGDTGDDAATGPEEAVEGDDEQADSEDLADRLRRAAENGDE